MSLHLPHTDLLAFAADTQAPMLVETILLKPQKNRKATQLLFRHIIDLHPHSFFLLGDVVNLGYSQRQWRPIDRHLHHLRAKGIGLYGIMGNHEVMGQPKKGEQEFQYRFPGHVRTGYFVRIGSIAVVLLNSNFGALTIADIMKEARWYRKTLESLDADPEIEFVICCAHHSPFTNSRIVKPSVEVQRLFVPPFLESTKSQLFLSGHCHAFEHFKVKGKDFMVIGGGGGLKQPLRKGIGTLADLAEDYKPMFHYITVADAGEHLEVRSFHLKPDFSNFEPGLELDIKKFRALDGV
jgi:hypothetical protein